MTGLGFQLKGGMRRHVEGNWKNSADHRRCQVSKEKRRQKTKDKAFPEQQV